MINSNFDHTSILRTVVDKFNLPKDRLGKRVEVAPRIDPPLVPMRTDTPVFDVDTPPPATGEQLDRGLSTHHEWMLDVAQQAHGRTFKVAPTTLRDLQEQWNTERRSPWAWLKHAVVCILSTIAVLVEEIVGFLQRHL